MNIKINKMDTSNIKTDTNNKIKIYYINLNSRTDRKITMNKFYKNSLFTIERYGVDKINLEIFKNKYPYLNLGKNIINNTKKYWVDGTLGCYDSHYFLLKKYEKYKKDDLEFLIILEDDCTILDTHIHESINFYKKNLSIDVLRINSWGKIETKPHKFNKCTKYSKFSTGNNNYYYDGGTHCCIYYIKNISKVINFLNKEYVFNIDAVLSTNQINSWLYDVDYNIKYLSSSSIQKKHIKNLILKLL